MGVEIHFRNTGICTTQRDDTMNFEYEFHDFSIDTCNDKGIYGRRKQCLEELGCLDNALPDLC